MNATELAKTLEKLGCPAEKLRIMAVQLDRKATMDAERLGLPYEAAIARLTGLMAQGWAATPKSKKSQEKTCNLTADK